MEFKLQNGSTESGLVLWSCQNPWSRVYIPLPTTGVVSLKKKRTTQHWKQLPWISHQPTSLNKEVKVPVLCAYQKCHETHPTISYTHCSHIIRKLVTNVLQKKEKERTDQKSAVLCQFFHNSSYNLIHLLETFH